MYIPLVNRILNSHQHSATGHSPYELTFGSSMAIDRRMLQTDVIIREKPTTPQAYVTNLNNALAHVQASGLSTIEDTIVERYLAAPETVVPFTVGDYVLYRNMRIVTKKLQKFSPPLVGPLRIKNTLLGDFYELQDLVQDVSVFAHASDMRAFPHCDSDEMAQRIAQTDYDEHQVIKILGHTEKPVQFQVKYQDGDELWLPFKDVKYLDLVAEYCTTKAKHDPFLKTLLQKLQQVIAVGPRMRKGRGALASASDLVGRTTKRR